MKRIFRSGILGPVLPLVLSGSAPGTEARSCSTANTAGKYGFTLNGVVILATGAVPIAAVGLATHESNGNVRGTEARSVGGGYADETFSGTLTVNSDCTGTAYRH